MVELKKKIHGTGTAVILSNKEVNDMVKIVKYLEDSDVLMKRSTETLQNDIKWPSITNFTNVIRNLACFFTNWKRNVQSWYW